MDTSEGQTSYRPSYFNENMLITGYKCVCTDGTDVTSSIVFNSTSGKWISRDRMYKNPSYSSNKIEYISFDTYEGQVNGIYDDTYFNGCWYKPKLLEHDNCEYIIDKKEIEKLVLIFQLNIMMIFIIIYHHSYF